MNLVSLKTLSWSTVAGAILSALALAAAEPGLPEFGSMAAISLDGLPRLPIEPASADAGQKAGASAEREGVARRPGPPRR